MMNKKDAANVLQDYSIIGKKSFTEALLFLSNQNQQILLKNALFEHPISKSNLYFLLTLEEFLGLSIREANAQFNEFPIQMQDFVKA